jgi:hypothetical protein
VRALLAPARLRGRRAAEIFSGGRHGGPPVCANPICRPQRRGLLVPPEGSPRWASPFKPFFYNFFDVFFFLYPFTLYFYFMFSFYFFYVSPVSIFKNFTL